MINNGGGKGWVEYLRFITPILISIAILMLSNMDKKIEDIQDKLFRHLTNDEMHSPRSLFVTKAEFSIYQELRQAQMSDIKQLFSEFREENNRAHDALLGKMGITTGRR